MKISSKRNVEKDILLFWQKKTPFSFEKLGSQIKFCAIKEIT